MNAPGLAQRPNITMLRVLGREAQGLLRCIPSAGWLTSQDKTVILNSENHCNPLCVITQVAWISWPLFARTYRHLCSSTTLPLSHSTLPPDASLHHSQNLLYVSYMVGDLTSYRFTALVKRTADTYPLPSAFWFRANVSYFRGNRLHCNRFLSFLDDASGLMNCYAIGCSLPSGSSRW